MKSLILSGAIVLLFSMLIFAQNIKTAPKITTNQNSKSNDKQTVYMSTSNVKVTEDKLIKNQSDGNVIDDEKTEVLIDWGMSQTTTNPSDSSDEDVIPYSFGVFKGVFYFDGKNFLVFESEEGTISFINLLRSGEKVKWKVYFQIKRS